MPVDLAAALQPIATQLLPGWQVTCEAVSEEQMEAISPGALAVCVPVPTRSIAHIRVLTPWPPGESLEETLWHELTHAMISPITSQLGDAPGTVMVEEQIVERLSVLLARIPLAARLAVARAINTFAPAQMRARLSTASAGQRAREGAGMDGKQVLAAIAGQDEAAALKILNDWAAEQLASAGHPGAPEPYGDELPGEPSAELPKPGEGEPPMNDPKAKPVVAGASPGPETPAEPPARAAARQAAFDAQHLRARKAADATVSITVRARLRELRVDGVTLPTNVETSLGKMTDLDAFEQRVSDLLEGRKLATPGGTRARATTPNATGAPPPSEDDGPAIVEDATLKAEGFDDNFVNMYKGAAAHSKKNAEALLSGARSRRASHRAGSKGAAS